MEYVVDIDPMGSGEAGHTLGPRGVRCRDCVHAERAGGDALRCDLWSAPEDGRTAFVPGDGFCYLGEE